MNTCSNCGAAVRPEAKFCTACGTRLNDASASAASSEWTSGQRTEAEAAVTPASDAAGEPNDTTSSHVEVPQSSATSPASDRSDAAPAPWSWRSSPLEPEPSPVTDEAEEAPTAPDETESSEQPRVFQVEKRDTPSPSSATDSSEEFTWTWSSSGNTETEADTGTRAESGNGIDPSDTVSRHDVADDIPTVSTTDEAAVDAAGDEEERSASPTEAFWPPDDATSDTATQRRETDEAVDGDPELVGEDGSFQPREPRRESATEDNAEPAVTPSRPAAISGDEDPLDRARRLIEELRTLIPPPRLYREDNRQPAAPAIPEGLRDDLEAARSSSDFGELRSTLESARARPRDVDTILELVGRIDTMLEALDDRDRLATAVDRAINRLDAADSADRR